MSLVPNRCPDASLRESQNIVEVQGSELRNPTTEELGPSYGTGGISVRPTQPPSQTPDIPGDTGTPPADSGSHSV